ncbi:MAG: PilN domain-containing protein [bacterium]|nr:MAG: PilN domain-containing protein [bacterium]
MFTKNATGIGLEDGGQIRVVELTSGVGGVSIRRAGSFEGGENSHELDLIQRWAAAIRGASSAGFDLTRVVVGLPASLTFKRTLSFPFRGRKRINQVLLSQLEGEIPLSPDDAVADFVTFRTDGKRVSGMAVACRQRMIKGILDILPQKTSLIAIQAEALGLATASLFGGVSDGAAVLCSEKGAVIAGMRSGRPSSFRLVSYAKGIEDGIPRISGAILDQIEDGDEILVACEEGIGQLTDALSDREVSFSEDPGTWPIFRNFEGSLDVDPAIYLPALGYALKGIGHRDSLPFDLRQGPFKAVSPMAELKAPAGRAAVLAAGLALLAMISLFNGLNTARTEYEHYADSLRSSFAALFPDTKIVSEVAQIQEKITQLERRTSSLAEFSRTGALEVLGELSREVPEEIDLKIIELSFDSGRLRLEGTVSSFDSVDRIKEALESSDLFTDVRVQNARVGADVSKVSFRLQMEVI